MLFNTIDMIFIQGEANLLPWSKFSHKVKLINKFRYPY